MLDWNIFEEIVVEKLGRDIRPEVNPDQDKAINAPINESQFIVAGPGSGKTTVMVLKILKFIYVDDINPSSILATTFTRKAAAELRSRILSWGDDIRQVLLKDHKFKEIHPSLRSLDFNQIVTGTIDSISQDILKLHRAPGEAPPVVIQDFVTSALMLNAGLFNGEKHHNENLKDYLTKLRGGKFGFNTNEMCKQLLEIKDRAYYDQVDWQLLAKGKEHHGFDIAHQAINDYLYELESRSLYDFAMLEAEFLDQLKGGKLDDFLENLKVILVDEYQDSNLLQEQIYLQLAQAAIINGGSMTVVGDDDQSLYRFRGATVDLFTNFQKRFQTQIASEADLSDYQPEKIYLSQNYRSTENIVNFCNDFVTLDSGFQPARVKDKPKITPQRNPPLIEFPILGMFREDVETLARDLSQFIQKIVCEDGYPINEHVIKVDPVEGSATDLSILCSSPQEKAYKKTKLPGLLREQLKIPIFNPRGQNLEDTWEASVLCGLLLDCIDPECEIQDSIEKLPYNAKKNFKSWRKTAREFVETNPEPATAELSLKLFVEAWRNRKPLGRKTWKKVVPLLDVAYKLVTWLPSMQDDVEGLVYLEAVTRTISDTALFSNYAGELVFDEENPDLECYSVKDAYWNIFVPLATGAIKVDEGLLETLPDNRINIMSIHQSKGLEFPLVIVDVGSDFRTNHPKNAFKRFPEDGGKSCTMEDEIRSCSPLGLPTRSGWDRAFDDLIRHYFVAFSRAQDVLLLVGLDNYGDIPNVATGYVRDGDWPWGGLDNLLMI